MKKLFSLLITLFMATALWAQTATAPSGSGTSGDPYLIASLNNLYWVTQNSGSWDKYFRQTADIDASTTNMWDSGKGFLPIGLTSPYFTGTYDGNMKKITGLYINRTGTSDRNIGLFGMTSTGSTIQNLGLENVNISGYQYVGALVGRMFGTPIVSNCYSTGNVNSTQEASGGLLGVSAGTVEKCYTSCTVSGYNNAGGFVGLSTVGSVTDCYSTGNVTITGSGGASFAGYGWGLTNSFTRCYATGTVTATGGAVDGFINPNGTSTSNCFHNIETNSFNGLGTGASTKDLQNPALYTGFDFTNTWRINPTVNNGYPTLAWQGTTNYAVQPAGTGAYNNPYLIASLPNLYWLHNQSGSSTMYYFKQTANIDATATSTWCGGQGWVPIGLNNKGWIGDYDGQNYQISNLYMSRTSTVNDNYFGLFGFVGNNSAYCFFNNMSLVNVNFSSNGNYMGAFIGATLANANSVRLTNCNSSGAVTANGYIGGLVGSAVGMPNYFMLKKCYSTCSVSAYSGSASYVGGVIGRLWNFDNASYLVNLEDCYARGPVTSNGNYIGGFAGVLSGYTGYETRTGLYRCYSTGAVTSSGSYKGGLIGLSQYATILNAYWDTQTSGQSSSSGGTGLTTAQMKVSSNYSTWDFTDIWFINSVVNNGYPSFGLNSIPTITTFSPTIAIPGTIVTITGTNFSSTPAGNIVYFGAAKATVTAGSSTSLTVTVPAGATYAPITVLNTESAREARSTTYFMPTYSGKGSLKGSDFDPKVDFSLGTSTRSMIVADFDNDGKPDIVGGIDNGNLVSLRNTSSSGSLGFSSVSFSNSSNAVIAMGSADFDGDGKLDIMSVTNGQLIYINRNTSSVGSISFGSSVSYSYNYGGFGAAVADFDGDGKPDLVKSESHGAAIVYRNISNGSSINFTYGTGVSSGGYGIACGDLDGDGKPDIAISNRDNNRIDVYLNTSTGPGTLTFSSAVQVATGTSPWGVTMADLDGDGKLDLAAANSGAATVSVFRNTSSTGSLSFAAKLDLTTNGNSYAISASDLDGDGKPDIIASTATNKLSAFHNSSSPGTLSFGTKVDYTTNTVTSNIFALAIADFDSDGKPDIASANYNNSNISVLRNNPQPDPPTITSFSPNKAAVGATVTIVGTNYSTTPANNIVFFGATQATVSAATATSLTVTVPSGATYAPITVLNTEIKLAAYSAANFMPTYTGTGSILATDFSPKVDFNVDNKANGAAMGDLDGDGKPDLAIANGGNVSIFRNTASAGTVSFAAKVDYALSINCAQGVSIADVDADGKPDVIVAVSCAGNVVSVFKNTSSSGTISFASRKDFPTISNPPYVLISDMDIDGKPDIVLGGNGSDKIAVLRNTSSGGSINFAAEQTFGLGDGTGLFDVKIGDMDGDGLTDVVFLSAGKTYFTVLRNTGMPGNISFTTPLNITALDNLNSISIGDIDGDGKLDIATTRSGYSTISTFRNNSTIGAISFSSRNDFASLSSSTRIMMGDLDGNGKLDLAVTDANDKVSLFSNTGSSGSINFASKVDFVTGVYPYFVGLIGDVDGDNLPDLITSNYNGNSFSVLRNNTAIPPTITSFTPVSAGNGTTVSITGTDFTGATLVKFGGTNATSFNVVNSTTITAVVATGTTGDVSVTTMGGTATKSGFTFIPAPVISSFTPTSSGNGLTVTISGTNFTGATAVSFGGTAATSFNVVDATTITAVVGSGSSGNVSVTTPGGTGTLSGFTWVAAPSALSYSSSPIAATYGVAISSASPTVTGTVTAYSISPALPAGLSLNSSSGVISGTPSTISAQTDYTVTASNPGGSTTATVRITVDKKVLTITGATTANKVYDGNTTASVTGGTLNGIAFSDPLVLTQTGTFASKNVGTSITITSACSVSGTNSENYTLTQPALTARDITAKALTVSGATTTDKVYDGNTTASVTGGTLVGVVNPDVVTLTQAGTFASKNVGSSIAIASGCSIGGADVANYTLTQPTLTARNITAKALTVSGATTTDKIYDGNTTASVTGGTLVGVVNPDVVTLTQAGTFASKNVGSSIAITSGCSIGGADVANYTLTQPTLAARNITAKALTVSGATTTDKIYDGNTTASVSGGTLVGIVNPDVVTLTQTGTFASKNVGNSIAITSACTIGGADAGNYSLTQPTLTARNITAKALTVSGATTSNKIYDGNTTASVTGGTLVGVVNPDVVTLTQAGTFASKNVGSSIAITSGCTIGGADVANYTLTQPTLTARNITAKALTISGATTSDKIYDGNATASVTGGTLVGIVNPDVVSLNLSGTFANKNVGVSKAITSTSTLGGADAGNYSLTQPALIARNITAKALTISGATTSDKVYDGNTTASVTGGTLVGIVNPDVVTLTQTGTFASKNIGTSLAITSACTIGGADAGNYSLVQPSLVSRNITARSLTVTASGINKEYDGNANATVSLSDNRVSGDILTAVYSASSFPDKEMGTGKTVSVSGISISGADAGNYSLANTTAITTADITARSLTVTATGISKTYDANNTATVSLSDNRVSGDVFASSYASATFNNKNAGTGKPVSVSGITISGPDAGNYSVNSAAATTADITAKELLVSITASDKVYDGNNSASIALSDNRINGDIFAVNYASAVFADKNAGTGIAVNAGGITISGTDAANYTVNTTAAATADITKKSLSITAGNKSKVYDGVVYSPFTVSYSGFVTGEDETVLSGTLTYGGSATTAINAGSAYVIAPGGLSSSNYDLTFIDGSLDIAKKALSITADNKSKIYDGTVFDPFTVSYSGFVNGEDETVLSGTLAFSGTATTAVNVGTGYIITPEGLASGNYAISFADGALEITKSDQLITFTALADKTFGDAAFNLTATASSGLTVSYTSSNTGVAIISGSTVSIVGAGTTIITASQPGNGNYNAAASVSQPLTVANQAQTIVFDELTPKIYGDAPFTVSATGGGSGNPVIFSSSDASVATCSGTNGTTITIVGAGSCTIYANQAGNADYGAAPFVARTLTVNKASQTITFAALADKTYGDAAFTLSGTSSSGLVISYTSSNPEVATVSGNTVTIKGAGSTTITARQAGNSNYHAATLVDQTLTVVKASQTITFASLDGKTYGDADFSLTGTSSSGLPLTYTSSNTNIALVSGNTVSILGAGTVTITASQPGNANYHAATSVDQSLSIVKAGQTITFAALADKTYGDAAFALTATASSGLAVSYSSSNTAVATVSGSTITIVGAGTAILTASQAGDANYTAATSVDQTLTVNKANQVLTLNPFPTGSQSLKDATGPVQLTATSSSGLPVVISLGAGSAATLNGSNQLTGIGQTGTIVIHVDQAGNANYHAASISATFDLGIPNQTILFPAMSDRIYSPGLTVNLNGSASASSTLPVSYSVISGPATLSGTVLTVTGSGVVWIKASQSGNDSWNAAPDVSRSLNIHKASLIINNFADLEKTYGDAPFALNSGSVSTGPFSYSSSNAAVATFSGNTVTITGAGTTELTVVQAEDANYASVSTTVILNVLQADQTISFGTLAAKTYADAPFSLTATASSGLPVSYTSSNPDVAIVSGNTVTIVGSGSTTITAMQLGNTNYKAATPVAQTLTAGKKSQLITFNALAGKTYGDADFNPTATSNAGLAVSYTSSNPLVATVSGSTVTIVGAGTTTITASQTGNANYMAAADASQTLTVAKANQVLSLSPLPIGSLALKDITFPIQVTAGSSSGLPVTISLGSGSAATLNGSNQLENIQSSGTITIELNQAGDANYNPASASYSFDVEKSNQHITFPAITDRVLSAGLTIDLSGMAYASSGLSVDYTLVSGPATLSGTVLTISGAGDVVITATQAGNSTWNPAPDVTRTISIGKSIPEILNFADLYKTYGDAPFNLNASSASTGAITYTSSDETVVTVEGSQVIIKGAGTVVLTATQASDASYAQASATASLVVDKAEQTISFDALPVKTCGDAAFDLAATSTSGLAISYTSSNTAVANVSGSTVSIIGAGTAIITATQAGNSNYKPATAISRTLTVNKQSQAIAFAALSSKTYGDAPFMLTATGGGSGNPVIFTSSDNTVATVSGNMVTIIGAGSCTIYASQAGNANYSAAPSVGRVLTVGKADQTISFDALADKTYGDAAFDPAATSTSGLAISYISSNTAVATVSGNTVTITGTGTTSITAIQPGNSNYNAATTVVQSLTVIKSHQTITFTALAGKTYGDAAFNLTATASSGLTVSYTSSNTAVATISGSTVSIVGAGTTTITASQPGNGNYNAATSVSQPLTVANQGQSIVFNALPVKTYGDAPFTVSATGGASGNPVIFSSSDASVATCSGTNGSLITITGPGTCTITASQAGSANYETAIAAGQTLTVEKASQSITFQAIADHTFGDAPFELTATASSNLPVSFTSSNEAVATVSGNTITIVGAGTTTITANQAGNSYYKAAPASLQLLTVKKQAQSIVFHALISRTYGDEPFVVEASGGDSGNPVVFTSSNPLVANCSGLNGSLLTIIGSGTCTIFANQIGSQNFETATQAEHTLVVKKADQIITFDQLENMVTGDPNFNLSAVASSNLPVVFSSSNETVAKCTGNNGAMVVIVGAGNCTIYANQAGNTNYNAAMQTGQKLTVFQYIAGDKDRDGEITPPKEITGDTDGDGKITAPKEIAGDKDGDGKITLPEITGDTNGDGKISSPEIAGDTDGDGKITAPKEIAGDTDGDGKITAPKEIAGDKDGDGKITFPEITGDTDGDGKITAPKEIAGDKDGDGKITFPEITGDTYGDGKITAPKEIAGDKDGDGKITFPEITGDTDGDGKITAPKEIAGDKDGDGKITFPEITGDTDGDGKIMEPEIAGDSDGDGRIGDGEVAEDKVAEIKILTIGKTTFKNPEKEVYYLIDCEDEREQISVSFSLEGNATSTHTQTFEVEIKNPGFYREGIQVKSRDGKTVTTYQLIIEKRFNSKEIIIQKYDNVLLVNNNPATNGGYHFVSFNWYRNGQFIGSGQYYSAGDDANDKLDANAVYFAEMKTDKGELLQTCDFTVSPSGKFSLNVLPNPVNAGNTINVITTYTKNMFTDSKIIVRNLFGKVILQEHAGSNNKLITLPSNLAPGIYVVTSQAGDTEISTKIIVH